MNIKLISSQGRKNWSYAPADSENQPTLILMIGVASKRSIMKRVKKSGHVVTQEEHRP